MSVSYTSLGFSLVFLGTCLGCIRTPRDGRGGFTAIAPLDTSKYPIVRTPSHTSLAAHEHWDTLNGSGVYCDDTSLYSPVFLKRLRELEIPVVYRVEDGRVFDEGHIGIPFPELPKKGERWMLSGKDPVRSVSLMLERINYTSLRFEYRSTWKSGAIDSISGLCHLSTGLLFGAESDEGRQGAYLSDEYLSEEGDGCLAIRLGSDADIQSAYVTVSCPGHIEAGLSDGPQLLLNK